MSRQLLLIAISQTRTLRTIGNQHLGDQLGALFAGCLEGWHGACKKER